MSNEDNKTHGGKGINTPTAKSDKNFREKIGAVDWSKDAKGKPRTTHNGSQALTALDFAGGVEV